MLTPHQEDILTFVHAAPDKQVTFSQLVDQFGKWYYANQAHNVGLVVRGMEKNKLLHRVRRGVYTIGDTNKRFSKPKIDPDQMRLF